eukprot:CAMPEP_0181036068 /NCGR_PEP_ID=MMETSP1070-20121207/8653_1 /TAXON_ID=265543 /ORGANISM="Minutocellus polymorphus, Strain NH13" /LENGTH=524 /DNA_ID=CAMNT_0023113657 /DNA_START=188 /DNA_END=1761 /DNA_ORIENTATION=-
MADAIRRKLEGRSIDRPELRITTSRSSDAEEGGDGHPMSGTASVRTSPATADNAAAAAAAAAAALSIPRCSSTDSRESHFSNLTNTSSDLAAEWQNICAVSSSDRLDQPLSPSILTSPECVRDRGSMDGAVSTTLKRVSQLHSFLSDVATVSSASSGGIGRRGAGAAAGGNSSSTCISGAGSIRRVGSKGEDSVGEESTRSDDSLRREESELTCAADEMKREMEGLDLDRLLFMQISSSSGPIEECISSALSNDEEDDNALAIAMGDRLHHPDGSLNYCLEEARDHTPVAGTPNRKPQSNPYENGASPSGVAEFNDDRSSSSSSLFGGDTAASPFRLMNKTLLNKFDSAASVGSGRSDASSCQLASPQQLPSSGWVESLAELAFGTHEYQVKTTATMPKESQKLRTRTVEGGLFVTASVSVVLAILLRTSDLVAVTEQQFYAAMAIIPPMLTLLEAKVVPHQMDETKVALSVLLGGLVLERVNVLIEKRREKQDFDGSDNVDRMIKNAGSLLSMHLLVDLIEVK